MNTANVLHIVRDNNSPERGVTEERHDTSLRPTMLADYVGQVEVIANVRGAVRAARRGGWQLEHMLIAGPPGTGKTTLALVLADELGAKLRSTSAPAIGHKGALASVLAALGDGDVLFVDELHALGRKLSEMIYSALEDGSIDLPAGKRVVRVPLPKFTLLGATTHAGKIPKPLLDRFGFVWHLRPYALAELAAIIVRSASKLGIAIDAEGARVIARASRGIPRIANRLLRRVRDAAVNAVNDGAPACGNRDWARNAITGPFAVDALAQLGIDHLGLDALDRRYLAIVSEGPVGVEAICAELAEDRSTIADSVEPALMRSGLIKRSGRGRVATSFGIAHLREQ